MSNTIQDMNKVIDNHEWLKSEMKSMYTLTTDDGQVKFERILTWLEDEDNVYQMRQMCDLADLIRKVTGK